MAKYIPDYIHASEPRRREYLQQLEYIKDYKQGLAAAVEDYNELAEGRQKRTEAALDDTRRAIQQSAEEMTEATLVAATAQIRTARQNAAQIVGAITENTDTLVSVGRALDDRLNLLIDQARINSYLLHDIGQLLRIPDFQKERRYFIEQGFKHYQNGLYAEALENLLQAEEREKTDYIVLHRIGMIYLYKHEHYEPGKAEYYLERAGRYAAAERHPDSVRLPDALARHSVPALGAPADTSNISTLAAESFKEAGMACYAQKKLPQAIEHSTRAAKIDPDNLNAGFNLAKFLAAADRADEAMQVLEPVIRKDRQFAAAAANDPDLAPKPQAGSLLERLRTEAADTLARAISRIESAGTKLFSVAGSAHRELQVLKEHLRMNTYFALLNAIDHAPLSMKKIDVWKAKQEEIERQRSMIHDPRLGRDLINALNHLLNQVRTSAEWAFVNELEVSRFVRGQSATLLMQRAFREVDRQASRWFLKDFSEARKFLREAAALGQAQAPHLLKLTEGSDILFYSRDEWREIRKGFI